MTCPNCHHSKKDHYDNNRGQQLCTAYLCDCITTEEKRN